MVPQRGYARPYVSAHGAAPDGLPPLGELTADDPFWRHPLGVIAGECVAHLGVAEPGYLAVVTETGSAASITQSAGHSWSEVARRHGPFLVLLEHYPAPEAEWLCGVASYVGRLQVVPRLSAM